MDIQKIIGDLVSKLTGNNDLIAKFTKDPLSIVKNLLGIDLDPSQLASWACPVTSARKQLVSSVRSRASSAASNP